jgi:metal-responsive CopG/Arc/MetJ family transcriptional regulator
MKTAISLPDPLFEEAERLAARLGVSRSELFRRAMEKLLRDYNDAQITEAINRVHEHEPSGLDPALAALQAATLPRETW